MKLKFNTVKIPLSTKEKRDRVRFYNEYENENVDEEEFIKQDIFEKFVDMKCLHCKYEERIEADILFEMFSPYYEDYPSLTCPHCERDSLVPLDIFNQLKNK